VKPPAPDRRTVVPWPAQRVAAVAAALPDRYRATMAVAAGLGLRQGECFGLAVEDVDFLRGVAHVRRQVRIVRNRLVFAPPKTGKTRDVPLPESVALRLAARLEPWRPWRSPCRGASRPGGPRPRGWCSPPASGRYWPARTATATSGNPRWTRLACRQPETTACTPPATTNASALLEDGVNIRAVAEYLGHNDPGFTLRVYAHLMPSSDDRARQAVDRALADTEGERRSTGPSALKVPR